MRCLRCLALLPGLLTIAACISDPTGPPSQTGVRLSRLTEFGGITPYKQRGTYTYDGAGRLARFDFASIDDFSDPGNPIVRLTYYSVHRYEGERPAGGEVFVRKGEEFVQSREWEFTYDGEGRITRSTTTWLLANDFSPIHEVSAQEYRYDRADRLIEVIDANGQRWSLEYDEQGNVRRETLFTFDGDVIFFDHTYDDGKNPFFDLAMRQQRVDGIIVVVAPWALFHSPRNIVRTETRVLGIEGVISVRTVEIEAYGELGYPLRSVQELRNTGNPDGSVFFAEYEYESPG